MLPNEELPREKLLKYGIDYLSDEELLCIILRSGIKGNDIYTLSHNVLLKANGLLGLKTITIGELLEIRGISLAKACSIMASIELAKRLENRPKKVSYRIIDSIDLYYFVKDIIGNDFQEQLILVCLDSSHKVVSCDRISKGTLNMHIAHPRDIFRIAIKNNAYAIALAHNHPSGSVEPSQQDISTTKFIQKAAKEFGIILLDHLIVTQNTYTSMRKEGYLG